MAAIPRDAEASPSRARARSRCLIRSRATLDLPGVGLFRPCRPPLSRRLAFECLGDGHDVLRSISTAAAADVDQPTPSKVAEITRHILRPKIEARFRKRIRQPGIWIAGDRHV